MSGATVADIPDQQYTGNAIVPTGLTVTLGANTLTEGTDYIVTTDGHRTGTATATITGQGLYYGTVTKTFRIINVKSGSCGNSATYKLIDAECDGRFEALEIGGTGAMSNYVLADDTRPWVGDSGYIKSLTIGSGITHIGDEAFSVFHYLKSVTIPDRITTIGEYAFYSCGDYVVGGVTINAAEGSQLSYIGPCSFYACKEGTIDLSNCNSLTAITDKAFCGCLATVILPCNVNTIDKNAFSMSGNISHIYVAVPDGFVLTANDNKMSVTDGKADIKSVVNPNKTYSYAVTLTCAPDPAHFEQTGDNEYTIHDSAGWDVFCDLLAAENGKNYFYGKTVVLETDIGSEETPITRMAGFDYHDFTGTFEGAGHTLTVRFGDNGSPINENNVAPFRNVENGCTIRNLHVCGDIYTSGKFAAGLVGTQYGTVTISGCRSSVTIHSSTNGDGTHGGLVACVGNTKNAKLTIEGCVFDGKLLGSGTTSCGGFVGYRGGNGTVTITNSLFDPKAIEIDNTNCATFMRNGSAGDNCYYTRTLGTAQGKAARTVAAGDEYVTVTAVSPVGDATANYSVSGITAYGNGIVYGNRFYYGSGDAVSLTLGHAEREGYVFSEYTASKGTLSGSGNTYTLTMPDEDVTVSAAFKQVHTVTFYAGDDNATGEMAPVTVASGESYTLPASTFTAPAGKTFKEWSVVIGEAEAVTKAPDETITVTADTTVTAVWEAATDEKQAGFVLPQFLTLIGESAFEGISAEIVEVTGNVAAIEARAFADCKSLREITIPASVKEIDDHAFDGCEGVTVYGTKGTEAERIANLCGFTFIDPDAQPEPPEE
jgi:hypothetical protein